MTRQIVYDGAVEIKTLTSTGNPIDMIVYSGMVTVGDGQRLAGSTDSVSGRIYLKNYAGKVKYASSEVESDVSETVFGKVQFILKKTV